MSAQILRRRRVPRLALRPRAAARALGVSLGTLGTLTRDHALPVVRVPGGRARLYPVHLLRRWLAQQAQGGAAAQAENR